MEPEQLEVVSNKSSYEKFVEIFKTNLQKTVEGESATFLYAVRSHLPGRIHMRWWKKYHGYYIYPMQHVSNKWYNKLPDGSIDDKINGFEIKNLEDQLLWIKTMLMKADQMRTFYAKYCPDREVVSIELTGLVRYLLEIK